MASSNMNYAMSGAASDLGLGSMLRAQTTDELEEQRKRRLMMKQTMSANPVNPVGQSMAASMLFGNGVNGFGI